jgi:hypothetical protein
MPTYDRIYVSKTSDIVKVNLSVSLFAHVQQVGMGTLMSAQIFKLVESMMNLLPLVFLTLVPLETLAFEEPP